VKLALRRPRPTTSVMIVVFLVSFGFWLTQPQPDNPRGTISISDLSIVLVPTTVATTVTETVPPETVPPETVPPETVPPETVPPETVPPETVAPDTSVVPGTTVSP
jgi:outer membrane biosynthesis protein TonB